jgi:hypothetical protein
MARDEARTTERREDLHRREDLQRRENFRDDLHEGGISPEKISGRTHPEPPPQGGISPDQISGGQR